MTAPVIIINRETETTRNSPVSRRCVGGSTQSYPARVTGPLHPHSKSGVREVVTIRIAALVAGGRIVASIRCSEHLNPPAIHFQSAVTPADTGALRRFLSVARLRFDLSRLIRLPGSRFSGLHRAFAVRQNFLREWANPRQVLSLSAHVLGLAAGVYGQHIGRSEMKCPTKALKDSTK